MKMNNAKKGPFLCRAEHVVWKIIKDKVVLLNLDSGAYFETNGLGLDIFKLCDGKKTLEEIASIVSSKFKKGTDRVYKESKSFIEELEKQNLVKALKKSLSVIRPIRR